MDTQTCGQQQTESSQTQMFPTLVQSKNLKVKAKGKKRAAAGNVEGNQQRTQCRWKETMLVNLINIMLEITTSKGKRSDNGSKKDTYKIAADLMNQRGFNVTSDHVQSKPKQMKKEYSLAAETIKQSGFSFDHKMKCITADDDAWTRWIEKKEDAASLQMKWLPYYEELVIIFGKDSANGDGNFVADDCRPETQAPIGENAENEPINLDDIQTQPSQAQTSANVQASSIPVEASQDEILQKTTPKNKRRKSRFSSEDIVSTFEKMASAAIAIAKSMERPNMKKVDDALKALPGMDKKDVIRAINLLGMDQQLTNIFFGLDVEDRKDWIMEKLT